MSKKAQILISISLCLLLSLTFIGVYYWISSDPFRREKKVIASSLIDPASAAFRDIVKGKAVVCGYVSGKHKPGGSIAEKPFIYTERSGVIFPEEADWQKCGTTNTELPRKSGNDIQSLLLELAEIDRRIRQSDENIICLRIQAAKAERMEIFYNDLRTQCPGLKQ